MILVSFLSLFLLTIFDIDVARDILLVSNNSMRYDTIRYDAIFNNYFSKAVMVGGLVSTTLLGTIIEKKDLYANLAAESYLDMADDPEFWKQMSDGMSPEDQEKAKELMTKIKAKRAGDATAENNNNEEQPQVMASQGVESSTETETTTPAPVAAKYETAKASNDMFSDY